MANFSPTFGSSFGGGMPDAMQDALRQKYAIQAQEANNQTMNAQTQRMTGEATAQLTRAQAGEVAPNAVAQRGLVGSQAADNRSQTSLRDFTRLFLPAQMYDASRLTNAQAFGAEQTGRTNQIINDYDTRIKPGQLVPGQKGAADGSAFDPLAPTPAQRALGRGAPAATTTVAPTTVVNTAIPAAVAPVFNRGATGMTMPDTDAPLAARARQSVFGSIFGDNVGAGQLDRSYGFRLGAP